MPQRAKVPLFSMISHLYGRIPASEQERMKNAVCILKIFEKKTKRKRKKKKDAMSACRL